MLNDFLPAIVSLGILVGAFLFDGFRMFVGFSASALPNMAKRTW